MELLVTPAARFADLPAWDLDPVYVEVTTPGEDVRTRVATYSVGPLDSDPILLLHGEPSWSYLYRHMVDPLLEAGHRVVMVDLVGFGRSDKPSEISDHSYARHVEWVRQAVLEGLALSNITLVCQDWGGLVGLRVLAENREAFKALVVANTGLPSGEVAMPEIWHRFREVITTVPDLNIGWFVASGCVRGLSDEARLAYDAPFPDDTFMAGPRAMPNLIPLTPDSPGAAENRAAWDVLCGWDHPVLVAFSDSDPITGGMAPIIKASFTGAQHREHPTIVRAGHFLQEDAGVELATEIVTFLAE